MSEVEIVEDFFGVYLLYNINPKYKGRTYIGYTRDPNRRIMQHNRGTWAGGAYRTSNRGPWKMALIIHGFPNNISALRFEWAWQNPNKTIRLQHLNLKKLPRKESEFQYKLRVMTEMLQVGPWYRLPLVVRWLEKEYLEEFPPERAPPSHMSIVHGIIKVRNFKHNPIKLINEEMCSICSNKIDYSNSRLKCINYECDLVTHIYCLANIFLIPGDYVPIEGSCPNCKMKLKWGDLIRKMRGCTKGAEVVEDDEKINEIYQEDELQLDTERNLEEDKITNCEEDNEITNCVGKIKDDLPYWFDDCCDL